MDQKPAKGDYRSRVCRATASDSAAGRDDQFLHPKDELELHQCFPSHNLYWVGLDGSELLTHMTPVVNYNSQCGIDDIRKGYTNHRDPDACSEGMILFGNGDGGGGPTAPMLERLRRARAVGLENAASGSELPLVKMGGTMAGFLDKVRQETNNGQTLPDWYGELYLEIHRGVITYDIL